MHSRVNNWFSAQEQLAITAISEHAISKGNKFPRETKTAAFIRDALSGVPRCKICGGSRHSHSISIDHIKRRADGGHATLDNAQLTHPYCNTTYKH